MPAKRRVRGPSHKGPGHPGIVGVAKEVEINLPPLAAPVAEAQDGALVSVVVIRDGPAGIEPREVVSPAQTVGQSAAPGHKAASGEISPFRLEVEMGRALTSRRHNVNHPGNGIRTEQGAFRTPRDLDVVHAVCGQGRKVEVAAELIQLNAINHHQVVVRVPASNEQAGDAPAPPGCRPKQPREPRAAHR